MEPKIINFTPLEKKEETIANEFAKVETADVLEVMNLVISQLKITYLFRDIDVNTFIDEIMNRMRYKNYDPNGKLKREAIKGINKLYSTRTDISLDEFYEEYMNREKK